MSMSIQSDINEKQHILHCVDGELNTLNSLLLEMVNLVVMQLDETMQALEDGDIDRAEKVIIRDNVVNQYEIKIDAEALLVLASQCPVAIDLRTVISVSKIADELERIGDEICDFARLVMVLFDPKTSDPNPKLLKDIVRIGNLVKLMLDKIIQLIETRNTFRVETLRHYVGECETVLQQGIEHQLHYAVQDARLIGRALDIMQILKSLHRCGDFCKNIAEYMIYMVDGVVVPHQDNLLLESSI